MAEPTFANQVEEYGNELRLKQVLKQDVTTTDGGTEEVEYKVFYKGDEVKIWPVDANGQVIAGSEPIFENGEWKPGSVTKPIIETKGQGGSIKTQKNVTFAGVTFDEKGNVDTTSSILQEQLAAETRSYAGVTNEVVPPWAQDTESYTSTKSRKRFKET